MKSKWTLAIVALLAANLVTPVIAQAESLDELNRKESAVLQQSDQISSEVQNALTAANETYAQVEATKQAISDNQAAIKKAQAEIAQTEKIIAKREAVVAERLKNIQVNGSFEYNWSALLTAESITDFINRAMAITQLQSMEKEKIDSLHEEKTKLEDLQATVVAKQADLQENEANLEAEASDLDAKVADLQAQLAKNQSTLADIAASKELETARIQAEKEKAAKEAAEKKAQEKAAKEAAEKEQAEAAAAEKAAAESSAKESSSSSAQDSSSDSAQSSEAASDSSSTSDSSSESTTPSEDNNSSNSSSNGNYTTMTFESTAYSYAEAGASYFTASGTDLRTNPQAVAVDPSVIPLGTLVEVEGYGLAVALDTGGAIKGRIIDVHFADVDSCYAWGRRQVQVKIYR